MLINGKELEKILDISRTTLWRLRQKGLPFVNVADDVKYEEKEVMKWLKNNKK